MRRAIDNVKCQPHELTVKNKNNIYYTAVVKNSKEVFFTMFELIPFTHRNRYDSLNPFSAFDDLERSLFSTSANVFRTDIKDLGDSYELEAELPGFNKEDIKISIDGDYLTISAQTEKSSETSEKDAKDEKDEKKAENKPVYVRRERSYGYFSRSFDISEIDSEAIKAEYKDGILRLALPKKEARKPGVRQLEIG